ncbi:MAG: acetate--CoA ligase family protein [Spirochaetes bacterium]|nr:acetate--CoA ligase family protein [Spirochaetota bacterium]
MRLTEAEGKAEFAAAGIKVPRGVLVDGPGKLEAAFTGIGFPCVIKAQVLSGGRGKAGLVSVVRDMDEALAEGKRILAHPAGVPAVLVEECVKADRELYLSVSYDPRSAKGLLLVSAEGGMEIEKLATVDPGKIVRIDVDLAEGIAPRHAKGLAYGLGLSGQAAKSLADTATKLWGVFRSLDAELAEINPLFLMRDDSVVAGDAKLLMDDNAAFRHPEYPVEGRPYESETARLAAIEGIPYLQFDGDISLMCAGAGLTTTVYDLVVDAGGSVANYLEFGGPNYRKAVRAMELCLANAPKVVLIVTFGTIARADVMARGIAEAVEKWKPTCPIVVCIRGTGEEEAKVILEGIGLEPLMDTEEAVARAVAAARAGGTRPGKGGARPAKEGARPAKEGAR